MKEVLVSFFVGVVRFYENNVKRHSWFDCFVGVLAAVDVVVFLGMDFLLFVLFVGLACVWVSVFPEVAGLVMFGFGVVLFALQIPWGEG